ncbi:MAG: hypothetical protein QM589_13110 [Thermomicrobiales bacterium]
MRNAVLLNTGIVVFTGYTVFSVHTLVQAMRRHDMIETKIRKQGNSFVVTIPREQMEHYSLADGDEIAFAPTKIETRKDYLLDPEMQKILDGILDEYKDVLVYLAER